MLEKYSSCNWSANSTKVMLLFSIFPVLPVWVRQSLYGFGPPGRSARTRPSARHPALHNSLASPAQWGRRSWRPDVGWTAAGRWRWARTTRWASDKWPRPRCHWRAGSRTCPAGGVRERTGYPRSRDEAGRPPEAACTPAPLLQQQRDLDSSLFIYHK